MTRWAPMMPSVLVIENALDEENCVQIRHAMDVGVPEAAEVLDEQIELQEDVRRTSHIEVDEASLQRLDRTLDADHRFTPVVLRIRVADPVVGDPDPA